MNKTFFTVAIFINVAAQPVPVFALEDFATVVNVARGTKTFLVQDYQCFDRTVKTSPGRDDSQDLTRAVVGGALGYSLGHRSDHRDAIAAAGAVAGWASSPKPDVKTRTQRVCENVMVPDHYYEGYELTIEYKGERKRVQSDTAYDVGDSYPISINWN